jgi:exopolyphosphatase / guanosine-5'-triphosphate,3'-diphosphate pyrophosphatase
MRIAAIDVGSNSVHMIVCRIRPDLSFEVVDREKDMIRLGATSLGGRRLSPAAVATAMQTLAKFKRLAESRAVDEIIATATSAVREAENGADFITAARRDLGLRIRVISGTEEARLIHVAAGYTVGIGRHRSIVIDIGGGSTEITLGTATRVEMARSFKLGAIRLTERFATDDPISPKDEERLVRHIRRETGAYLRQIAARGFDRVIGASGTMLSIGGLAAGGRRPAEESRNLRVAVRDIGRLRRRLSRMPLEQRLKLPGLDPRRADLSAVGAVLIDTLLGALGATELTLSDFALREGLVLDYIRRNAAHIRTAERYPDVRRRSVIELAERFHASADHGEQIARLALALFDSTAGRHGLGQLEREWLEYGARLHDIGHAISYEQHHKHSYYLIKNGGLRGFEPEEIAIIALIARYHRQGQPKKSHEGFGALPKGRRKTVRLLSAMVRLAEGLDRSHTQVIERLTAAETDGTLRLQVQARGDAELELWAAHRHAEALARALGLRIDVVAAAPPAPAASRKDSSPHAEQARHTPHVPGTTVRRRGHRRVGKDHAARAAGQVARRKRSPRVRH